jgi:hypothetical protein
MVDNVDVVGGRIPERQNLCGHNRLCGSVHEQSNQERPMGRLMSNDEFVSQF